MDQQTDLDKEYKAALNQGARALHEWYFGKGTWLAYGADGRQHARRSLQKALTELARHGYVLVRREPGSKA